MSWAFTSQFQHSRIRTLRNFFGARSVLRVDSCNRTENVMQWKRFISFLHFFVYVSWHLCFTCRKSSPCFEDSSCVFVRSVSMVFVRSRPLQSGLIKSAPFHSVQCNESRVHQVIARVEGQRIISSEIFLKQKHLLILVFFKLMYRRFEKITNVCHLWLISFMRSNQLLGISLNVVCLG